VEQFLSVLFVVIVGSFLLPATRVARVIQPWRTRSTPPYHRVMGVRLDSETDDHSPVSAVATEDYKFRPLTQEEKRQFVGSLDVRGKQVLVELAGQSGQSGDSKPLRPTYDAPKLVQE
jgi:hypothetical protein